MAADRRGRAPADLLRRVDRRRVRIRSVVRRLHRSNPRRQSGFDRHRQHRGQRVRTWLGLAARRRNRPGDDRCGPDRAGTARAGAGSLADRRTNAPPARGASFTDGCRGERRDRMRTRLLSRIGITGGVGLIMLFLYVPVILVAVYSFNRSAVLSWPPDPGSLQWYQKAFADPGLVEGL